MIDVVQEHVERAHALLAGPACSSRHSASGMMCGRMSNGISRSAPLSSPYTAKVMPTRWNRIWAACRICAMRSPGVLVSQSASGW